MNQTPDWSAIAARLPRVDDTRIQTSRIPNLDYWMLKAAAACKKRYLSSDAAYLLSASIRSHSPEWCEMIAFQAAQEGISFEDMFVKLASGE